MQHFQPRRSNRLNRALFPVSDDPRGEVKLVKVQKVGLRRWRRMMPGRLRKPLVADGGKNSFYNDREH